MVHFLFIRKRIVKIYWHRLWLAASKSFGRTGTHTSTPVYVFVNGPEQTLRPFAKILHHTQVGQLAIDALR